MKKILIRIVGSLCILASLAVLFLVPSVKLEDVSRKDLRTYRKTLTGDLELVQETLLYTLSDYLSKDDLQDDLQDCDLPSSKTQIKNRFSETKNLLTKLLDEEISLKELMDLSMKAPRYIDDTENLLETNYAAELIFETSEIVYIEDVEDVIEVADDLKMLFWGILIFFFSVIAFGVVAAVTHSLPWLRFIKYFFLFMLVLTVVIISVGVPLLNELIQDEFTLAEELEDMTLAASILPYTAILLAIVPVVLDIIFERKKPENKEITKITEV